MRVWVDIEDSSGDKIGPGPIFQVIGWTNTRRMDRAGEFTFEVYANDERADLIAEKRYAHCRGIVNGSVMTLGRGIIDRIEIETDREGPTIVRVSGDDLGRELTYRSVGFLGIYDEVAPASGSAVARYFNGAGSTFAVPSGAITLATNDYLYLGHTGDTFDKIAITLTGTVNSTIAYLEAQYLSDDWTDVDIISDGTSASYRPFAQSGTIEIDRKTDWQQNEIDGVTAYWIRFSANVNLDDFQYSSHTVTRTEPSGSALSSVMAQAPLGWSLDTVNGQAETTATVYARFAGESVLRALVKLAEHTGEHFYIDVAEKKVVWLGGSLPSTGIRATQATNSTNAIATNTNICVIADLQKTTETYDLVTRIYPYGSGFSETRIDLSACTRSLGGGYTLQIASNYIENVDASIIYGRVEAYMSWKEVATQFNTDADLQSASNALFDVAYEYLTRFSQPQEAYSVQVMKLDQQINPASTMRVIYREVIDGYTALDIDDTLYILETTTRVDRRGVRTTGLVVSTVDTWFRTDIDEILGVMDQGEVIESHRQLGPNNYVTSYSDPMDNQYSATMYFWLGAEVTQVDAVFVRFRVDPLRSTVKTIAGVSQSSGASNTTSSGSSTASSSGSSTASSAGASTASSSGSSTASSSGASSSTTTGASNATTTADGSTGSTVGQFGTSTSGPDPENTLFDGVSLSGGSHTFDGDGSHSHSGGSHDHTHYHTHPFAHSHDITHDHSMPHDHNMPHTHDIQHTHNIDHSHDIQHTHNIDHTHGIGHDHTFTPNITTTYGVFQESAGNTLSITDLSFTVNGAGSGNSPVSIGYGWYEVDITSDVRNATTKRPIRRTNVFTISTATAKTAQINAQLVVSTTIQPES